MHRRDFLRGASACGGACLLSQLGALRALAQASDGYKALVCVFLAGGNDSNNTIVPIDQEGYYRYYQARTPLALAKGLLPPLSPSAGPTVHGLHPSLSDLVPVWDAGQLAVLFNVGSLVRPISVTEYRGSTASDVRIPGLFSHDDQVRQWMSSIAGRPVRTGWGGRLMEEIDAPVSGMPGLISIANGSRFGIGETVEAVIVPSSGLIELNSDDGSAIAPLRRDTWMRLLAAETSSQLIASVQRVNRFTLENRGQVNDALSAASPVTKSAFAGLGSGFARQLATVSKLIEQRNSHATQRQVFYVSLSGFDLHSAQLSKHASLLRDLGSALAAFNTAMNGMGAASRVTTFTHSEFSRTLHVNTTGGTDHAWGGHHFVMGGAVNGRTFYGTFPMLEVAGPDDADWLGRWVPTVSVDQYAATLATWFGVAPQDLAAVLPNLANFAQPTLPFMRA